ncbi:unnamed protein product [Rotaria sp. Silwood1]|nr:unnamed protein product [Rotaria sp. Silwood1]CAF1478257.1 unnamed protein product [Rotaria sp. Silwood1]CAF1533163.1 unnamed protein product [Rotaria sp. Silwood1]CAF3675392.1 unnamed protein product [Rotaria sp. Silwood1]CAF3698792.1 unnamed protein product [Rotaria sp. Silwood1]
MLSDTVYLVYGKEERIQLWYYILVPINKFAEIKANRQMSISDIKKIGRMIEYLNNRDQNKQMSGLEIEPPKIFQKWIAEHYSKKKAMALIYFHGEVD